jgi:hypothetical protein
MGSLHGRKLSALAMAIRSDYRARRTEAGLAGSRAFVSGEERWWGEVDIHCRSGGRPG